MDAPDARKRPGPFCGRELRLLFALIAAVAVARKSDRSPARSGGIGCVRVTVEATVADGQNSRVAASDVH
jgi:hypothetical protein